MVVHPTGRGKEIHSQRWSVFMLDSGGESVDPPLTHPVVVRLLLVVVNQVVVRAWTYLMNSLSSDDPGSAIVVATKVMLVSSQTPHHLPEGISWGGRMGRTKWRWDRGYVLHSCLGEAEVATRDSILKGHRFSC